MAEQGKAPSKSTTGGGTSGASSQPPSGSATPTVPPTPTLTPSSTTPGANKAIASLAKKQSDVTRLGTQKLKFVPTLPSRRKKEDVKEDPTPTPSSSSTPRGRGRGAHDRGRGRGFARGGPPGSGNGAPPSTRPPPQEMTASGPFAMGPALAGTSARRTTPRSNFTPIVPGGAKGLGRGLTGNVGPQIGGNAGAGEGISGDGGKGKGKEKEKKEEDDVEVYSDPDEGVEIVDMEDVRGMDWMAPESLRKEKKKGKGKRKLKVEQDEKDAKGGVKTEGMDVDGSRTPESEGNAANAVHLSDSEEEEEMEDIVDDFTFASDDGPGERLYFFQFPHPFPTFRSKNSSTVNQAPKLESSSSQSSSSSTKKVTFTEPTAVSGSGTSTPLITTDSDPKLKSKLKPSTSTDKAVKKERGSGDGGEGDTAEKEGGEKKQKVDGFVGRLEVYKSGAVKMRLGDGIVYDISAATQSSFLQHAVYLDSEKKNLCVLGEVNRRFVASPDIGVLLAAMEAQDNQDLDADGILDDEGLIRMDMS